MAQDGAFDEDWFELFGARGDGRGLDEPRRLAVQLGTARSRHVDGSCDVAQGLTRVSAHAQGPREHERRSDEKHDRCVLEVSATYAPFASVGARTGARRQDGRDLENAVRNALAPALMAERYPRALIKIHVLVTCDDGGATSAAINAAGLALVDAGIFLRGVVAAARVGAPVAATTLVDPNRAEARHGVALMRRAAVRPHRAVLVNREARRRLGRAEGGVRIDLREGLGALPLSGPQLLERGARRERLEGGQAQHAAPRRPGLPNARTRWPARPASCIGRRPTACQPRLRPPSHTAPA